MHSAHNGTNYGSIPCGLKFTSFPCQPFSYLSVDRKSNRAKCTLRAWLGESTGLASTNVSAVLTSSTPS